MFPEDVADIICSNGDKNRQVHECEFESLLAFLCCIGPRDTTNITLSLRWHALANNHVEIMNYTSNRWLGYGVCRSHYTRKYSLPMIKSFVQNKYFPAPWNIVLASNIHARRYVFTCADLSDRQSTLLQQLDPEFDITRRRYAYKRLQRIYKNQNRHKLK